MNVVRVVFDIPLNKEFDYLPGKFDGLLSVGARVLAPLGKQRKVGWVAGFGEAEEATRECKEILKVYDRESLLTPELLEMAAFAAQRYLCSSGQILAVINKRLALQGGGSRGKEPAPDGAPEETVAAFPPAISWDGFGEYIVSCAGMKNRSDLYLAAARALPGGSALFIFPEVDRAKDFYRRLRGWAGDRAVLFHGGLSRTAKAAAWERMRKERNLLVAGSRIAVFSPLSDLRIICADNAWDSSYIEQQAPHYHAVELAGWRARRRGLPFVVGETDLSVEEYHRVAEKKAVGVHFEDCGKKRPDLHVLALTGFSRDKVLSFLARDAVSLLEETLLKGGRVMLIHNRKGAIRMLACGKCGHRFAPEAAVGGSRPGPRACPKCGSKRVAAKGYGVDRIKKMLEDQYPGMRVTKKTAEEKTASFPDDTRIVVGTQAAVSLLDRFAPELVIIVSGDAFLTMPDFRAEEKFFLLMREVCAGLDRPEAKVLLQAGDPDLPVYRALRDDTPETFYEKELTLRRQLGYPPFGLIIRVEVEGTQKITLEKKKALAGAFFAERDVPVTLDGPFTPRGGKKLGWKYIIKTDSFDRIKGLGELFAITPCSILVNPDAL